MKQSDAEKMNSEMMNARSEEKTICHDGGVRVVFIGNSITIHGVLPEIGWFTRWGMAASAEDKDYVHIVTRGIEEATGRKADVRIRNLADFERNFKTYDLNKDQDLVDFQPEYLVFALGENVPDLATEEERLEFRAAFKALLGRFMYGRMQPHAVVRGCFWPNEWKDAMMSHAASDFSIPFIRTDISDAPGMTAAGLFEHSGVAHHPGDKGMAEIARRILEGFFPKESGYHAWIDGAPAFVRPIRISAMPFNQWAPDYQRPMDQTEIAGMLQLEIDQPVDVRIRPDRAFSTARIRPLKHGLTPVVKNGEIEFRISVPGYYVLELDGYHSPLEIFAEPRRDFAKERQEANIVFGPGIHAPVIVKLHSHDRVFIDKDALVYASFQADNVEDVKVSGYGIICGSRNRRVGNNCYREGMDGAVRIIDSKNITFDGPVVLDSACWCVSAFNSSDLELSHLKVTAAWRYNTDGIDICNSQRVHIHDCYVHSFDDAIVLKGTDCTKEAKRHDPEEDILVERCVCWCGWGRTLEIGFETFAPYFRNIVFRDCDLIHNNGSALSVHLGGPSPIEDITYSNIRIECDASEMRSMLQTSRDQKADCPSPAATTWLDVTNCKMFGPDSMYDGYDSTHDPYGTFNRLTVDAITITVDRNAIIPRTIIQSCEGSTFGTISITNVCFITK